jgi:hypothetical protein
MGFFEELGRAPHYHGSIRDAARPEAGSDEADVLAYLRASYPLLDVPSSPEDVISGDTKIPGGDGLATDGTWIWRIDLPYYVERYHLALPDEFREHAKQQGYQVPVLSSAELGAFNPELPHWF